MAMPLDEKSVDISIGYKHGVSERNMIWCSPKPLGRACPDDQDSCCCTV